MIDIFMLILVIVLSVILLVISVYLLAYYCHPSESGFGSGLLCKIFAVIGLAVAGGEILLLPLDVSNTRGNGGGFRMDIIYMIFHIAIAVLVFGIFPFLKSMYENDPDDKCFQKIFGTFCFFITEIIAVISLFVIFYFLFNKAKIPISSIISHISQLEDSSLENEHELILQKTDEELLINVSFPIFCIGFLCFISYFLFTIFGSIGLIALPIDMIYSFISAPKKINKNIIEVKKKEIAVVAAELKQMALQVKEMENNNVHKKSIFSSEKRKYDKFIKQLKGAVSCLTDDFELIKIQNLTSGSSILGAYLMLISGSFCAILSLLWIIQILVYVVIRPNGSPLSGFLNSFLVFATENGVSFLSIGLFTIMCLYLLLCTVKGCFKFGLRFPLIGAIYPMKKNETFMNSFLFNISLVLLSSVSVSQFCLKAFNEYAAMTDFDLIFSVQINYLGFFKPFQKYHIFEYFMCGLLILTLIYLLIFPSDSRSSTNQLYKTLEKEASEKKENTGKTIEMVEMSNN